MCWGSTVVWATLSHPVNQGLFGTWWISEAQQLTQKQGGLGELQAKTGSVQCFYMAINGSLASRREKESFRAGSRASVCNSAPTKDGFEFDSRLKSGQDEQEESSLDMSLSCSQRELNS